MKQLQADLEKVKQEKDDLISKYVRTGDDSLLEQAGKKKELEDELFEALVKKNREKKEKGA